MLNRPEVFLSCRTETLYTLNNSPFPFPPAQCPRVGTSHVWVLWPEFCWHFHAFFIFAPFPLTGSVGICLDMPTKYPPHSPTALLLGIYYKVLLKFSLGPSDFWFSHLSSKLCGFILYVLQIWVHLVVLWVYHLPF